MQSTQFCNRRSHQLKSINHNPLFTTQGTFHQWLSFFNENQENNLTWGIVGIRKENMLGEAFVTTAYSILRFSEI
jgi:hypothetical protein